MNAPFARWFGNPELAAAFTSWCAQGKACAVATVVGTRSSAPRPVGSKLVICENGQMAGSVSGGCVENAVAIEALDVIATGKPIMLTYGFTVDQAFEVGLPCGGEIDVFVERAPQDGSLETKIEEDANVLLTVLEGAEIGRKLLVRPGADPTGDAEPSLAKLAEGIERSSVLDWQGKGVFAELFRRRPRVVIVGAVDIAEALAALAASVGWRTICIDPRAAFATSGRLPSPDETWVAWPDEALEQIGLDRETAVVVLLHDEKFIVPALVAAIAGAPFYIGLLGSRRAQARWQAELVAAGVAPHELSRLSGPAGLAIGAESPGEIAVSIFAEMLAVRNGQSGGMLREGSGAIHEADPAGPPRCALAVASRVAACDASEGTTNGSDPPAA